MKSFFTITLVIMMTCAHIVISYADNTAKQTNTATQKAEETAPRFFLIFSLWAKQALKADTKKQHTKPNSYAKLEIAQQNKKRRISRTKKASTRETRPNLRRVSFSNYDPEKVQHFTNNWSAFAHKNKTNSGKKRSRGIGVSGRSCYAIVASQAKRYGVPTRLAIAIARKETRCRNLRGRSGEVGEMQVLPRTARYIGCGRKWRRTAHGRIGCGMKYLASRYRMCRGNLYCTARSYNGAGSRARRYARSIIGRM